MTNASIPDEEQIQNINPEQDTVVTREGDEGVRLRLYVVSGDAVSTTRAKTYTRAFGHYFVSNDSEATPVLDDFVARVTSDASALTSFVRRNYEAYEVSVEVDDSIVENDVAVSSNETVIEIPSHSENIEKVDTFLTEVENDVQ